MRNKIHEIQYSFSFYSTAVYISLVLVWKLLGYAVQLQFLLLLVHFTLRYVRYIIYSYHRDQPALKILVPYYIHDKLIIYITSIIMKLYGLCGFSNNIPQNYNNCFTGLKQYHIQYLLPITSKAFHVMIIIEAYLLIMCMTGCQFHFHCNDKISRIFFEHIGFQGKLGIIVR